MRKTTAVKLLVGFLILAGLAVVWTWGRPAYRAFKEHRFERKAVDYLAAKDFHNAWLCALQARRLNTNNLPAAQILVKVAALSQVPAELDCRRVLADLDPTIENQMALAETGLRLERPPFPVATRALSDLAISASNLPAFHVLSAELALKSGQPDDAAHHFRRAGELEPTNPLHAMNLAVIDLGSTNTAVAQAARAKLDALGSDRNIGAIALNWLVSDEARRTNRVAALVFSKRLVAHPAAGLKENLQHLDLLRPGGGKPFSDHLVRVQDRVATNAMDTFSLTGWMVAHGQAGEALAWLDSLPASTRSQHPVPVATMNCLLAVKDWPRMERELLPAEWGQFEHLRHAFLSEAARQMGQQLSADARWRAAVHATKDELDALGALSVLARDWGRPKDRASVLWALAERYPQQRWVLMDLHDIYVQTLDTRGLNRVTRQLLAYDPRDRYLRNDLAATSLLLDQGTADAAEAAAALHKEFQDNPIIASTHAFALHKMNRTAEGLAVFRALTPSQLELPPVAIYYAVLLEASGQHREAVRYAALARKGSPFPEEQEMLRKIDAPVPN